MKFEKISFSNVNPDGTFINQLGSVIVSGCNCSPGYWLTIISPRTSNGEVEGIKVKFDSKEEMDTVLDI